MHENKKIRKSAFSSIRNLLITNTEYFSLYDD